MALPPWVHDKTNRALEEGARELNPKAPKLRFWNLPKKNHAKMRRNANFRNMERIKVFSPATVSNVASGFDIFGFALDTPGDEIVAYRTNTQGITIPIITGDQGLLSKDPTKNVAGVSVQKMLDHLGLDIGIAIEVHKKMPMGSGLGSSSASSVGAIFAVNELLGNPLTNRELLPFAMEGERVACGTAHADNVAPALFGGFVLIRSYNPIDVISIPLKIELECAVLYPHVEVLTREARERLPKEIPLQDMVTQTGNAAALIAGLLQGDRSLIAKSLHDAIVEKIRAPFIPGYDKIKQAALKAGALGCNISGSGPSIFALSDDGGAAEIGEAMKSACEVPSDLYISRLNLQGPRVVE